MQRILQRFLVAALLVVVCRDASAFSLLGPLEGWQTQALGYDPLGNDIGGPKNLGQEYRWNQPVITYGFDNSFLNYFGSNGVAAVDEAVAILESVFPVSQISPTLNEYAVVDPATGISTTFRDARRQNYRAAANNIVDLKSVALGVLVEELGLASPERWTWALRDRKTSSNPDFTNYLVIQRNFDPATFEPSKYVNGIRYTYEIFEFEDPTFADAIEDVVDPEHVVHAFSTLANIPGGLTDSGLASGVFYTYLTRDDIGGLRYLYHPENLNWEPSTPGTQIFAPGTNFILLTNQDLTLLSLRSLSNSPAQLSNFYPGIIINQSIPYFTNLTQVPQVTTQQIVVPFITNTSQVLIITNQDLFSFSMFSRTSAPPALRAAFPDLIITSTNFALTTRVDVADIYLTNGPREPWGDPNQTNLVLATNFVTNLAVLYSYTYLNVITNYSSPTTTIRRMVSGVEKEPWSDPLNPIFKTNFTDILVREPSGGIIIVPTNLFGYQFLGAPVRNLVLETNVLVSTNMVINNIQRLVQMVDFRSFTNAQFAVFPIEFINPPIITNLLTTNFVSQPSIFFRMGFANVITNYVDSFTTPARRITTVVRPDPFRPGLSITSIVEDAFIDLPVPSGGFIIDTNLTGFQFTGFQTPFTTVVTNVLTDVTNPATGERTTVEVVYTFRGTVFGLVPFELQPAPAALLRPGIDRIDFVKWGNGTIGGQPLTMTNRYQAAYFTNGMFVTNTFITTRTQPDIIFRAADLGTLADSVRPVQYSRSANFQNNAGLDPTLEASQPGPGTIVPTVVITFNNVGPSLVNRFPLYMTEAAALDFTFIQPFVWGRFDGSTNPPVVFPKDITLEQIEARMLGRQNP